MANRRILAIVTAMLMLGSSASAQQATSIEDLRRIEALVSSQNWAALYSLVASNPALTNGSDALSVELRGFMRQVSTGQLSALAPAPATRAAVPDTVRNVRSVSADIY